jgi:hypothetical protein
MSYSWISKSLIYPLFCSHLLTTLFPEIMTSETTTFDEMEPYAIKKIK